MPEIIVIAHNIRSTYNVGSLFRTCDGFGVQQLLLSGYTPYPETSDDSRLPHIRQKITREIHKTALGAENSVTYSYYEQPPLAKLRANGYTCVALEQDPSSTSLPSYISPKKVVLLLGEEVHGIAPSLLSQCDTIVEIPMVGKKESFNVSVAAAVALYQLTLHS